MSNYWNDEDDEVIICPYCGKKYEPSYEECYIGGEDVDCYTEDEHEYTCDCCGKRFVLLCKYRRADGRSEDVEEIMRLIDADRLILHLNDYALSETPVHEGDDNKVYRAIMDCIDAVEEAETVGDASVINLIFDENGIAHGYDSKYTLSIMHESREAMEETKRLLLNMTGGGNDHNRDD